VSQDPQTYEVRARAAPEGAVRLTSVGLPSLETDASAAHGGPGDRWSPPALLVAAAVDCYALAFRLSADASRLRFESLECRARGLIQRDPEGVVRLIGLEIEAELALAAGERAARAERLLHKAERNCIVTQSLRAPVELRLQVSGGT
jgi:organic hydroperoxide reductase OsmC/OhrA